MHVHGAGVFLLVSALVAIFPNAARANVDVTAETSVSSTSTNNCTLTINTLTGSPDVILASIAGTNAGMFTAPTLAGATVKLLTPTTPTTIRLAIYEITGFTPSTTTTFTIRTTGASAGETCGAAAFSGVASVGTVALATGTSTSPSVTVTSPGTGGVVFDTLSTGGAAGTVTPGTGQVEEWEHVAGSGRVGGASVAPPRTSMHWTLTTSVAWGEVAVPLIAIDPTEVHPTSFTVTQRAVRNQVENVIQLNTGREVHSLGFNLYREQNGQKVKLNSSLLAGTALLAGGKTTLTAGYVHTWSDAPSGASSSARYWVEEVDLNGQRSWYGPATPAPATATFGASVNATTDSSALTTDAKGQVVFLSQVGQETGEPGTGVGSRSHPLQARAVRRVNISQNTELGYALAAAPAVKIGVESEGWYSVPWAGLVAAGLPANANANTLQLYAEGVAQPILVHPQTDIEFYGTGLDTTWSGTRIYWLTWGKGGGLRVQSEARQAEASSFGLRPVTVETAATAGASSFPYTVEWMPRTVYFAALLDGDGSNNFFGPVLTSGQAVSQAITVTHLAQNAAGEAQLRVALQGASANSHSVEVALNGRQVGTVTFSNETQGVATLAVPSAALVEGQNKLTLTADGGDTDVSLVDNVELTYPHSYTADSDSLRFTAAGGQTVTIAGFSSSQIGVVDVTNPDAATIVPGKITAQAGGYAVTVTPQGAGSRTLLAFTSAQEAQPASVTTHHPSSWHAQAGYDMVMISHANFLQSLTPLVSLHQGQGLKTAVINVEDLYDEFNFGEKSPQAVKDFLSTANAQWETKPRFVMLVGDATLDPRNYLGLGNFDFVPTYLVDTTELLTASDDWYADFSGQGIPQMAIGRLPVRTAQKATALVTKIVNYEKSGDAGWTKQVLLVADQNDSSDNFQGDAAAVKALLPGDMTVSEISNGAGASEDLLNSLNTQGAGIVDYIGHGSEESWATGLFDSTVASSLTNGSMVPFVVDMTCLNGYFQDVYETALAKALMEAPGGGALAVWASSSLTDSGSQAPMNQALIKALFGAQPMTIGEAAATAKSATSNLDVRRTWILFGDPATKLQ